MEIGIMADDVSNSVRGSRIQAIKLRLIQQGLQLDEVITNNSSTNSLPSTLSHATSPYNQRRRTTTTTSASLSSTMTGTTTLLRGGTITSGGGGSSGTAVDGIGWLSTKSQTLPRNKSTKRRYQIYFEKHTQNSTMAHNLIPLYKQEIILKKIFSFLTIKDLITCTNICRAWRRIADQQYAIYSQNSNNFHLSTAHINFKMYYNRNEMVSFARMCYQRHIKKIIWWYLSDSQFMDLLLHSTMGLTQFTQLQSVSFIMCSLKEDNYQKLFHHLSSLRHVEFHGCNSLTEIVLHSSLPSTLESICIDDCMQLSNDSMGAICQLETRLIKLQLQSYHISDKMASYFQWKSCPNLCQLSLQHCLQISHYGFATLFPLITQLTHLDVSGCSQVCDDTLDVIATNLKSLQIFECAWCPSVSDAGLECLACDLHSLKRLVLDRCSGITDVGIDYLTSLRKLESLSLRWCPGVNDIAILHILKMKDLLELCLTGCRVTRSGLLALQQHETLAHLEMFNLTLIDLPEIVQSYQQQSPHCIVYV